VLVLAAGRELFLLRCWDLGGFLAGLLRTISTIGVLLSSIAVAAAPATTALGAAASISAATGAVSTTAVAAASLSTVTGDVSTTAVDDASLSSAAVAAAALAAAAVGR
jgi:hypothetical protein